MTTLELPDDLSIPFPGLTTDAPRRDFQSGRADRHASELAAALAPTVLVPPGSPEGSGGYFFHSEHNPFAPRNAVSVVSDVGDLLGMDGGVAP